MDHQPDLAEKRLALEDVLHSKAFLRADQLRNFLRYVCEMEMAGRAGELSEYLIGVEALGRPPGYSTTEDSSVRRQAHALREKLEEFYHREMAGAPLRIELPKGGYVPHYVPVGGRPARPAAGPGRGVATGLRPPVRAVAWLGVGALAGALATSAAFFGPLSARARVDPVLAEAWGPLAAPGSNLLICVAAPPHYGILPYPPGPLPPMVSPVPRQPELEEWYRQRYPMEPGDQLGSHLATGPIRLGEVLGLVSVVRTLDGLGADFQIVAEKNVLLPALRGRNLLLFGNPDYSHAAGTLLERAAWTIAYDPGTRERVVAPVRQGAPVSTTFVPTRDAREGLAQVFGLISVLPSEGAAGQDPRRTVIISCTNSAGCQAASEFFSSPRSMRELRERFRRENHSGFPSAYQVVIRSRVHDVQAISAEYAAHVTLPAS